MPESAPYYRYALFRRRREREGVSGREIEICIIYCVPVDFLPSM
jgi:hypothetical protein